MNHRLYWMGALLLVFSGAAGCRGDRGGSRDNMIGHRGGPGGMDIPSSVGGPGDRPPLTSYQRSNSPFDESSTPAPGPRENPPDQSSLGRGGGPGRATDGEIAAIVDALNGNEIQFARVALAQSHNEEIRQFAQQVMSDHEQWRQQQSEWQSRTGVMPRTNDTSRMFASDAAGAIQTLQAASGPAFDRAFIDAQVRFHLRALSALDGQLIPNAMDPQLRVLLQHARSQVEQHLFGTRHIELELNASQGRTTVGPATVTGEPSDSVPPIAPFAGRPPPFDPGLLPSDRSAGIGPTTGASYPAVRSGRAIDQRQTGQ